MNNTLQNALAGFGAFSALGYIGFGIWLCAASVREGRRIDTERAELRTRRAPLTEADIEAVDFDAELANLTKENGR